MTSVTQEMLIAAQIVELCNEAAFLAQGIGQEAIATIAGAAAVAAGKTLGLTEAQVLRMQAEQSAERARVDAALARRLRSSLRRGKRSKDTAEAEPVRSPDPRGADGPRHPLADRDAPDRFSADHPPADAGTGRRAHLSAPG